MFDQLDIIQLSLLNILLVRKEEQESKKKLKNKKIKKNVEGGGVVKCYITKVGG